MSDESAVLTVVGKNDGIKEKAQGWHEVEVSVPGKNYPVRLATKRTALIDALRATIGQVATFTYTETDSNRTNPNTGNPYKNRYLESVEAGAQAPQGGGTAGGSSGGDDQRMSKEEWRDKDRRDFRSRAWAQTISAYAHTIKAEDDAVSTFQRLKPFQEMIYKDIVQEMAERPAAPPAQPQQEPLQPSGDHDGYESGDYPSDDDIPF